jgi:hypothetical protein
MNFIEFINTYPFLFIITVLLVPILSFSLYAIVKRRKNKDSGVTIINQTTQTRTQPGEEENLEITGSIDELAYQKIFGIGRKIKEAIIGLAIAIPFAILSYLISENLGITIASIFLFLLFGYFWAKKWVKPEGVQIILDGDIDPENPSAGVQHIDYIIPYEQWKYIIFTDQGGAYPIKTIDGMAYRATSISFWDPEEKIVKDITLAWMHSPHSNFEQEHELNHKLATWLKIVLKELNAYKHLKDVLGILEAKNITIEREKIKYDARSSVSRSKEDIDAIMSTIKTYDIEAKKIMRTGKETREKVDKSPDDTNSGGDVDAGQ